MVRSFLAGAGICAMMFTSVISAEMRDVKFPQEQILSAQRLIEDVNCGKMSFNSAQKRCGFRLKLVYLSGTIFQFAPNIVPPDATVPGVLVSLAEYPFTRFLNITSNSQGSWVMPVIKYKGIPLKVSLIFEKDGFVTSKSNVLTITDSNLDSISMQFTDVNYYNAAVSQIEQQVSAGIGIPFKIQSLAVATVGKSWASSFLNLFPHGDPGASVTLDPPLSFPSLGPIYFNDDVVPDPSQLLSSVDGGVLFTNLPTGTTTINATKTPYTYTPVTFIVEEGINLYIASPPHSLQGTNSSGPGEW